MTSGDSLFELKPQGSVGTGTAFATPDWIPDASTPIALIPVLDFDDAVVEHAEWIKKVPTQYGGTTGFTFEFSYAPDGTAGGTTIWEVRVIKLSDLDILTGDLGIDAATDATVTDTAPATPINKLNITAPVALAKADAGTPVADDWVLIRVTRNLGTNTDDAQLLGVYVTET